MGSVYLAYERNAAALTSLPFTEVIDFGLARRGDALLAGATTERHWCRGWTWRPSPG